MAIGSLQYISICTPNGTRRSVGDCSNVGSVGYSPSMVQAYVLDTTAQTTFEALAKPFDYAAAASIFSFFFSFIIGCWFVSKNIGLVLSAIKRF